MALSPYLNFGNLSVVSCDQICYLLKLIKINYVASSYLLSKISLMASKQFEETGILFLTMHQKDCQAISPRISDAAESSILHHAQEDYFILA